MQRFHVNPETGSPGLCRAQSGGCPFGGDESHYPSKEVAQKAFELSMAGETFKKETKASKMKKELNVEKLKEDAAIVENWKGLAYPSKLRRLGELSDKVSFKDPVMIEFEDGSMIFDEAGNGYNIDKPSRWDRIVSGKPSFKRFDSVSLRNLRQVVDIHGIESITVLKDFPKLDKELSVGESYVDTEKNLAVFSPSLDSKNPSVSTFLKEKKGLGYWDHGIWTDGRRE